MTGPAVSITFALRRRTRVDVLLAALEARLATDAFWRAPSEEAAEALVDRLTGDRD